MARIRVLRVYLCAFLPETVAEKVPKYCADPERRAQKDFFIPFISSSDPCRATGSGLGVSPAVVLHYPSDV